MKTAPCNILSGDRDVDCETDILMQFSALVQRALRTGWAEEEVANALLSLAQNYSVSLAEDATIGAPEKRPLH